MGSSHADLGLLGSRTVNKQISLLQATQFLILCYIHHRKPIQHHYYFYYNSNYYRFSWFSLLIVSSFLNSFSDILKLLFSFLFGYITLCANVNTIPLAHVQEAKSQRQCLSVTNKVLQQMISSHRTNIYQTAYQFSQVIISLRDAIFKFIISKLYTTDVQVLAGIYLENDKVAESYKDRQNIINGLNIYNTVFAFYCQSYVNRIHLQDSLKWVTK